MAYLDDPVVFNQAYDLYMAGDVQKALDLLTESFPLYPDHAQRIYEWRFDMAAKLGKLELAEEILKEALDNGCFYSEFALRKDDDLTAMQGRPVFEELVERSFQLMKEKQLQSKPRLEIINPGIEREGRIPLFISLHGNSSNVKRYRQYWKRLENSEWLVALPQSSQVGGKDLYVWNDLDTAETEIIGHYRALLLKYHCRFEPIVISGFSKGAHAAIYIALNGLIDVKGFVAIAPYIPNMDELTGLMDTCRNRNLRGFLLLGGADNACTPGALQLNRELISRGFQCQVDVVSGLGHAFPEDFDTILSRILNFVLAK